MRIKDAYKVREVAGENLIVEQGKSHTDMTKVISLNSSALLLWNALQGSDFTLEEVADILVENYKIDKEHALIDAKNWINSLLECRIIE
ncbi:PqqD family protein [Bacteroides sp. OttesenSCG-928-N06]|nr:PqqD family protein [Bacteroides sp. OttesenSCG-928-N06]